MDYIAAINRIAEVRTMLEEAGCALEAILEALPLMVPSDCCPRLWEALSYAHKANKSLDFAQDLIAVRNANPRKYWGRLERERTLDNG